MGVTERKGEYPFKNVVSFLLSNLASICIVEEFEFYEVFTGCGRFM
jgi:hypothetical protein